MSVHLRQVKKIWHYRFRISGRRIQRTTMETNYARADIVARRAYAEAVLVSNGGQPVPTMDELFTKWLAIQGPVSSVAHVRSIGVVHRLHMYDLAGTLVSAVTTEQIELARNLHLETHQPSSVNHWLRIMNLIGNWAVTKNIIARLPWKVPMLNTQKRVRATLPLDVAKAWFDAIDAATRRAPSVATAVRLMFGLGLRVGEAASARWEWIDWQRATYTPGITKGREADPVPLPAWLLEHLAARRQPAGLIAPRKNGTEHAPGYARRAMRIANARCGAMGITPHRLRGTFATLLSEAGVPIQTIQKVMRHKNSSTTMAYLEKNMALAVRAQAAIAQQIGFEEEKSLGAKVANAPPQTRMNPHKHD